MDGMRENMKLSDQAIGDVILAILKGEHGTGKSIAAASYATLGPTYVFDFEDRMRSVAGYYRRIGRTDIIDNIEFDTYYSFTKVRKKLESLHGAGGKGLKNVVWDSLTSFTGRVLSNTKQTKADDAKGSGQTVGKTIGEFRVNSMEDFNAETAAVMEFVVEHAMIFKAMKVNFILTAHVIKVSENNDEGKSHFARYLMTGGKKAAQVIPGYYDEVYHFNMKPDISPSKPMHYTAMTRHSGLDTAKTSLDLPSEIDFTGKSFYDEVKKLYTPYFPQPRTEGGLIIPVSSTNKITDVGDRDV